MSYNTCYTASCIGWLGADKYIYYTYRLFLFLPQSTELLPINEMLKKTNTTYAPWHVLESNDKKYARIKALKIVIDAIEAALDNKTDKK